MKRIFSVLSIVLLLVSCDFAALLGIEEGPDSNDTSIHSITAVAAPAFYQTRSATWNIGDWLELRDRDPVVIFYVQGGTYFESYISLSELYPIVVSCPSYYLEPERTELINNYDTLETTPGSVVLSNDYVLGSEIPINLESGVFTNFFVSSPFDTIDDSTILETTFHFTTRTTLVTYLYPDFISQSFEVDSHSPLNFHVFKQFDILTAPGSTIVDFYPYSMVENHTVNGNRLIVTLVDWTAFPNTQAGYCFDFIVESASGMTRQHSFIIQD